MQSTFSQATVVPQLPGTPGHAELLQAATAPLREAFGNLIAVQVERLDRLGRWAFLQGSLRSPGGGGADFTGTRFAERAAAGGMSDVYVALLACPGTPTPADDAAPTDAALASAATGPAADQVDPQPAWTLLDHAIGPADLCWLTWPDTHAAPRQLFGF